MERGEVHWEGEKGREKRLTLKRARGEEERITIDGERKKARRYVFFYAFTRVPCILRFYCALISRKINTCIKTHPWFSPPPKPQAATIYTHHTHFCSHDNHLFPIAFYSPLVITLSPPLTPSF